MTAKVESRSDCLQSYNHDTIISTRVVYLQQSLDSCVQQQSTRDLATTSHQTITTPDMVLELLWDSNAAAGEDALVTTQLPGQFSDQVKEVSARMMQLLDSETMEQHQMAVANFSKVCACL